MPVDSDEELMRRFQSGEDEAFRVLFDRYASHLINFAYRLLSSRDESEDIAQEVLLRVYKGKDRYDPSRPFRPWIFSIASRLISNRLRDRKRHPQVSLNFKPDEDHHDIPTIDLADKSSHPTEEILEKQQLAQHVQKALADLPENQRTAVLLARFEEMPYEEIAATMGSSVSSVKSLLFRARQTLKAVLTPCVREER
jgi:RNA polymerase sigma-70 factor, ECF subfamily